MKTRTSLILLALAVFGLVAVQPAQAALLANWKMDENTGDTVGDSSGNAQDLARGGGTKPSWVAGRTGLTGDYALDFPGFPGGGTSYASKGSAITNLAGATNFTITCWMREDGTGYYGHWFVSGSTAGGGNRNWLGQNGSGGDQQMYLGYNNGNFLSTGRNPPAGTWTFVAITYDNAGGTTRTKIYLDTTMTTHNWGVSYTAHSSTWLGGWTANNSNFDGVLDDFSVWNETLSTAKINIMKNITTVNSAALKDYMVDDMKKLFDVYATGTPAWVDGTEMWKKFTGGSGTAGAVTYTGGLYYAFFDGTSGVQTPEPATMALLGLGGLGLILRRKRR
jgi:hypothetical protein